MALLCSQDKKQDGSLAEWLSTSSYTTNIQALSVDGMKAECFFQIKEDA